MAGMKGWRSTSGDASPPLQNYLVEASQTILQGDIVILAARTTANRVRKAAAAEIDFQNGPTLTGILGIAWHSIKTDANGNLVQNVPSTVDPGSVVNYPAVSYAGLVDRPSALFTGTTPDIGNARLQVLMLNPGIQILMDVAGAANAAIVVNQLFQGKAVGIQLVSGDFKLDTSQTGNAAGFVIESVNERETNYNVSATNNNGVWVSLNPAFNQGYTGLLY